MMPPGAPRPGFPPMPPGMPGFAPPMMPGCVGSRGIRADPPLTYALLLQLPADARLSSTTGHAWDAWHASWDAWDASWDAWDASWDAWDAWHAAGSTGPRRHDHSACNRRHAVHDHLGKLCGRVSSPHPSYSRP